MLSLLGAGLQPSELLFPSAWTQERLAGRSPRPPPLCTVLWNDAYRIIFLKCAKNAGNSVAHFFGASWQDSTKPTALRVLEPPWHPHLVRHLLNSWHAYTVFAFVRNPLRRAFSQYSFLVPRMAVDRQCYAPWDEYCRDPLLLGDTCALRKQCCKQFSVPDQYFHILPQSSCLLTEGGQLAVDFLGRVEFFEEDLGALVKLLNARPGVPKIWAGPAEHWNANRGLGRCQGSAAAARAAVGGSLGAVPNPCDRQELFEGAFAHCGRGLLSFFADDVRLLFSPTNGTA